MPPKNLKKNIKIVPIEDKQEPEPVVEEPKEEPKEEIVTEDIMDQEPIKEDVVLEPPKEEEEVKVEPIKEDEPIEPAPKPKGRKDRSMKVVCPDCGKTLTQKTFEYNHKFTCKTVKAQKKADEIKAKQKEKEEEQQLKKQQEEKELREKIEKELEEKYSKMNNTLSVEVPVVEKTQPAPPPTPKLSNMDIRRLNHMNRYSKLRLQII